MITTLREITITEDGDLAIGPDGDFAVSLNQQALAEHIMVRLRTYFNEASAFKNIGAKMEDFAGKPNTREVGQLIELSASNALTIDNFLSAEDFTITAVPESLHTVRLYIDPDPNNIGLFSGVLSFDIDLVSGQII